MEVIKKTNRPIAIVLVSTNHGTMLINRHDYRIVENSGYGVGFQILNNSAYDPEEVNLVLQLLQLRRTVFGDQVVAIDCGANIGVHTVEWAKFMHGWGSVFSFEAQERIYYTLAGNIAMNNCFNARAIWAAVGEIKGTIHVPQPNYLIPSSFGSLEIRENEKNEFIGQKIDYSAGNMIETPMIAIDDLGMNRLDVMKIDVEGMEIEVLNGASATINKCKPILIVEKLKSNPIQIEENLAKHGYLLYSLGINFLAIHKDDPIAKKIIIEPKEG